MTAWSLPMDRGKFARLRVLSYLAGINIRFNTTEFRGEKNAIN
jgi:hypothetical protein